MATEAAKAALMTWTNLRQQITAVRSGGRKMKMKNKYMNKNIKYKYNGQQKI